MKQPKLKLSFIFKISLKLLCNTSFTSCSHTLLHHQVNIHLFLSLQVHLHFLEFYINGTIQYVHFCFFLTFYFVYLFLFYFILLIWILSLLLGESDRRFINFVYTLKELALGLFFCCRSVTLICFFC